MRYLVHCASTKIAGASAIPITKWLFLHLQISKARSVFEKCSKVFEKCSPPAKEENVSSMRDSEYCIVLSTGLFYFGLELWVLHLPLHSTQTESSKWRSQILLQLAAKLHKELSLVERGAVLFFSSILSFIPLSVSVSFSNACLESASSFDCL